MYPRDLHRIYSSDALSPHHFQSKRFRMFQRTEENEKFKKKTSTHAKNSLRAIEESGRGSKKDGEKE